MHLADIGSSVSIKQSYLFDKLISALVLGGIGGLLVLFDVFLCFGPLTGDFPLGDFAPIFEESFDEGFALSGLSF